MSIITTKNTVQSFQKRSSGIVASFKKMTDDLISVNKEIEIEASRRRQEIARLQIEEASLQHIQDMNDNTIDKLNNFLS